MSESVLGLPRPLNTINNKVSNILIFPYCFSHCQQPSIVSFSFVFFPLKTKTPRIAFLHSYGSFHVSLWGWGTEQNLKKKTKTLMSTLHLKDVRHEIWNVVCTEVYTFLSAHRCEHYFVLNWASVLQRPELFLVRVAPVWVCCFPTIFKFYGMY